MVKDGLGSVRQVIDESLSELYAAEYAPYGKVWNTSGVAETPFAFTGEMLDDNGLQYHRARYLDPSRGVWMSVDPLETANRYGYVEANVVNLTDGSGMIGEQPQNYKAVCAQQDNVKPCQSISSWQTGDISYDEWIISTLLCKPNSLGSIFRSSYPLGYYKNEDRHEIADKIFSVYGISIENILTGLPDEGLTLLASISYALWLMARALETVYSSASGEQIIKNNFGANGTVISLGMATMCNLRRPFDGSEVACVPPRSLGGSGTKVHLPLSANPTTVIHEMGHVFDFMNGSNYRRSTLYDLSNPSTYLMQETGGSYGYICSTLAGMGDASWGTCIATQLIDDYFEEGTTTPYGGENHFEDFAESWEYWMLSNSSQFHQFGLRYSIDDKRMNAVRYQIEQKMTR